MIHFYTTLICAIQFSDVSRSQSHLSFEYCREVGLLPQFDTIVLSSDQQLKPYTNLMISFPIPPSFF